MLLDFYKMQGAGNDFFVLDGLRTPFPPNFDFAAVAQKWCDRHRGAGGDGLLLLDRPEPEAAAQGAAIRMQMWNPDGSEDMCGNGLRCIVLLAQQNDHVSTNRFIVQTLAGLRDVEIVQESPEEGCGLIRTEMGLPQFALRDIPLQPPTPTQFADDRAIEYALPVNGITLRHVTSLSTGSTHTVIFTETPVTERDFTTLSPLLENHPWFPERTSIMWACVEDRHSIRLRIWERGVGETLACGTGASAAAVAAQVTGRCDAGIDVSSRGGTLHIDWHEGSPVQLTGPAQLVYRGKTKGF